MTTTAPEPVATYLRLVAPWEPDTYVNIHAFEFDQQAKKLIPRASRAARDQREALSYARWCISKNWDLFLCLSSQKNPGTAKADKRGRANYRALRASANAASLKAFWVDIDVKPGAYETSEQAQDALRDFCVAIGLPRPSLLIHSGGGGFHAYWILDELVSAETWLPLAHKLADACRKHNLLADHNVTVNSAQILRIPGSFNYKYGLPRGVKLEIFGPAVPLDLFSHILEPFSDSGAPPKNSGETRPGESQNFYGNPDDFPIEGRPPVDVRDFLGGISSGDISLEDVAKVCPWIKNTLDNHGKDQREPLWFDAGHVACFTAGGVEDYHKLSRGHENYSPDETEAKFARLKADQLVKDTGWPRCQTIMGHGATQCGSCEHLSSNKSPLNFAVRTPDPEVTSPGNGPQGPGGSGGIPPKRETCKVPGYIHDPKNGHLTAQIVDKKSGEIVDVVLTTYPVWNLDYKRDSRDGYAIHFDTEMAQLEPVHVVVPTTEMRNGDMLRGCLVGRYGISVPPGVEKGLLVFMAAFKDMMRASKDTLNRQELMGWCDEGGKPTAFIFGPTRFNCNGNTGFNQPDEMVRQLYFPTGSPEPWMEAMKMLNAEQRPEMDMLAATAFAAPLMKFTGEKGVVISAFSSGTAVHKTTAIKIGQGAWGSFKAINQLSDTLNSVMERVGRTRVMSIYYDEMKSSTDIKRFASMLYTFTGGRGKGRVTRNIELRDISTWDTLLVGVSNDSLFDCIAQYDKSTDAGVARVFEFEVAPPTLGVGQVDMGTAGVILKKLETNYGHAGMKFAELLGKSVDTLERRVSDMITTLQVDLKAQPAERFWVSAAAVLLVGAQMANDINLSRFDTDRMMDFIHATFRRMRLARIAGDLDISKSNHLVEALKTYLNNNRRMIMATDIPGQKGQLGRMTPVTILNPMDVQHVNSFDIRFTQSTNTIWIRRSALTQWLAENKLAPGVFVRNMERSFGTKEVVRNITSGTNRPGSPSRVLELDLNHPDLVDLYEI